MRDAELESSQLMFALTQFGLVPDKLSVSEASGPRTAGPLRPHCLIQRGSTRQSAALGQGSNPGHWNMLAKLRYMAAVIRDDPYRWRGPTTVGTTSSSWTFCLFELL